MKIKEEDIKFTQRSSVKEIEEGTSFSPKFNSDGLLPCITIEYETNQITNKNMLKLYRKTPLLSDKESITSAMNLIIDSVE